MEKTKDRSVPDGSNNNNTRVTRGDGREGKGEGGEREEEGGGEEGEGKLLRDRGTDRDIEGSTKGPRGPKIASYFEIRSRKNQPNEPEIMF